MFKLTRAIMWLNKEQSGKREFAFIVIVFAMCLTVLFMPDGSEHRKDVIFYWSLFAVITGCYAFGMQAVMQHLIKMVEVTKGRPSDDNLEHQQQGTY